MNYPYSAYGANPNAGRNANAENGWGPYKWPGGVPGNMLGVARYGGVALTVRVELVNLVTTLMNVSETKYGYNLYGPSEKPPSGWCWGYSNRAIAGTNTASNHSKGRAVDLNAPANPYTSPLVCDIPPGLVNNWERSGFYWGGRYSGSKDAMHMEYCWTPAEVAHHVQYALSILGQAPPVTPPSGAKPFPLPAGYYYGPKSGPNNCISGMAGEQTAWINGLKDGQRRLMVVMPGCLPRYGADGKYGATYAGETYDAVRRFQTQSRIAVDGLLGRVTWSHLFS
jgi:peptidoglycan hydrolase-like protein with peptidoglycan-binding domain